MNLNQQFCPDASICFTLSERMCSSLILQLIFIASICFLRIKEKKPKFFFFLKKVRLKVAVKNLENTGILLKAGKIQRPFA